MSHRCIDSSRRAERVTEKPGGPYPLDISDAWCDAQERAFSTGSWPHSGRHDWDFSPESLDLLEELLLEEFADPSEVESPQHAAVIGVASWYIGEVYLRAKGGGYWLYVDIPERNDGMYVGRPYVYRVDEWERTRSIIPVGRIRWLIAARKPGTLLEGIDLF